MFVIFKTSNKDFVSTMFSVKEAYGLLSISKK